MRWSLHLKGAQIVTGLRQKGVRWDPHDTPIRKLEAAPRCRSCGTRRSRPPVHMVKLTKQDRAVGVGSSRRRCLIAPAEGAYSVDGDGNQMHVWCDLGAERGPERGPRPRRFPVQLRANPRNLESVARSPIPTLESG